MKFNLPLIVSLLAATPGLSTPMGENRGPLTIKLDDELSGAREATATAIVPNSCTTESTNVPQVTSPKATQEIQTLPGGEPIATAHTGALRIPVYRTHVKIYMLSTGDDPGDYSEMQGYVQFPGYGDKRTFSQSLHNEWIFRANGGLGFLFFDTQIDTVYKPANFRAFLEEYDSSSANEEVMNKWMDWTNPSNEPLFRDGLVHTEEWHNNGDVGYRALLWYQVTRLA